MPDKVIYDPLEFLDTVKFLTFAMVGSFVTWKFLNVLYDNLYSPTINTVVESKHTDNYYFKIGQYYVQADMIFREFIKWVVMVLFLMVLYNIINHSHVKKIEKLNNLKCPRSSMGKQSS